MKKFSFNSIIRKQPPKGVFIEAIWKFTIAISALASSLESTLALALQENYFAFRILFFKKSRISMFFPVLSYGINTTLLQMLIFLRFPVRPSKGAHWCSRKRKFELSEASVHWCFEKITAPKISAYFAYFPAKRPI